MPDGWVTFLLRSIPEDLLEDLRTDAEEQQRSFNDLVREILCARMELDCPPSQAESRMRLGRDTQLLLLQPELFYALKEEAALRRTHMRSFILGTLADHYAMEAA